MIKWVNRKFRLTRTTDFKRVRQHGRSYAHPLLVLIALRAEAGQRDDQPVALAAVQPADPTTQSLPLTRFAVTAGRSVGNAVQRNRARRRLREAVRLQLRSIKSGWDVIVIARRPCNEASFSEIQSAFSLLLQRAKLYQANCFPNEQPPSS